MINASSGLALTACDEGRGLLDFFLLENSNFQIFKISEPKNEYGAVTISTCDLFLSADSTSSLNAKLAPDDSLEEEFLWLLEIKLHHVLIRSFKDPLNIVLGDSTQPCDCRLFRISPTRAVLFPMLRPVEMQQFQIDDSEIQVKLKPIIEMYGFCVIANVLDPDEVIAYEACWGDDLLSVTDLGKARASNSPGVIAMCDHLEYCNRSQVPSIYPTRANGKDYSCHSLAHGKLAWMVRLNKRVKHVYQTLYPDEDLCVGMDCVFFSPKNAPGSTRDRLWGHADQNIHEPRVAEWQVYQSVVSIWPQTNHECSTTVILPCSHKEMFDLLMTSPATQSPCPHPGNFDNEKRQFVLLDTLLSRPTYETAWANERYIREARRVPCPSGGMIIWDSKLLHQG